MPKEIQRGVYLAFGVMAIVVVILTLAWCDARDDARKNANDRDMAQGRTTSAAEAINEIGQLEQRGQITDQQVQEAQNAIRQADPEDRDSVARTYLCRLQHRSDCDGL